MSKKSGGVIPSLFHLGTLNPVKWRLLKPKCSLYHLSTMECRNCKGNCIKKGCQNRRQKYYCKSCKLYQQKTYSYKLCKREDEEMIVSLNNEGVSISGISRIIGMSKANVIRKIKSLARKISRPEVAEEFQEYEMDELQTFIGNKEKRHYIIYTINKKTKTVIDFVVGKERQKTFRK